VAGGELGGEFEYSWQTGAIELAPTLREGSVLRARLAGANTAGGPPAQALAYLGGYGNLRGFERLEFAGKRSLAARLELEWGRDFLAATRIPGLRGLHLQLIPHADAGTTWGDATGVRGPDTNLDGEWRAAVGFGLRRNIYYPGFGSLRFDISWRTDGGEGNPEVWLRLGRFGD
jgi:hemolysin activation/secretion protein